MSHQKFSGDCENKLATCFYSNYAWVAKASPSVICGREATKEGHTFSRPLFLFRIKGGRGEICISSEDEGAKEKGLPASKETSVLMRTGMA